ncbi:carbon-nitrogen hydrolase family protein [Streptomyces alkaliterrae]|uniref:Carbon-nitrogen hydrolase n=1 Tax=Streptomyces alkaliterrae TaxID=2213162 RepID=A0A5P0YM49_9ACTN|nr:carbon-nitrogen hydrolase family protein [Streptomyces alkaliterrae]MBB1259594.1 carbon-nitrogen hydrolase family protein [Streptomyces alkaliterrae]MQS00980.1 carbon-nitrogen hydrolase [Streptomyces alkaliterrae]
MTQLRIALSQGPSGAPLPRAEALAALESAAARAAEAGARLLVTPELSLTGYALGPATAELAEEAEGPAAEAVGEIAARHDLAIVYGYPERDGEAVYNSARLIDPAGKPLANYRKTHLFGTFENTAFTPGDEPVVQAELDGVRLGLLVCYDVEFPETVRAHALAGTELLLVPTALMRPYEFVPRTLIPTRAWESQLYVAYANRQGAEDDLTFAGLSCLAAPDGTVRARAGTGEDLVLADVDTGLLAASRAENTYLTDLRTDLFHPVHRQGVPRR